MRGVVVQPRGIVALFFPSFFVAHFWLRRLAGGSRCCRVSRLFGPCSPPPPVAPPQISAPRCDFLQPSTRAIDDDIWRRGGNDRSLRACRAASSERVSGVAMGGEGGGSLRGSRAGGRLVLMTRGLGADMATWGTADALLLLSYVGVFVGRPFRMVSGGTMEGEGRAATRGRQRRKAAPSGAPP